MAMKLQLLKDRLEHLQNEIESITASIKADGISHEAWFLLAGRIETLRVLLTETKRVASRKRYVLPEQKDTK